MSFHSLSSDSLYAEGDFGNVSENTEAEQLHKLALTPVVIGLCILLLWTSIESFRHQKLRLSDPEVAVSSAGWELRRWFHLFLAISTFSRLVGVIVELCLPVMALESTTSISCWIIGLVHGIPDMLYLSTFCLVVSFFAKVYFTTLGIPSLNLYTLLLVANLSVYVSFVVVAVISLLTESYITLRVFTFAILAVSYAVAMSLMLGFGFRLSNQLRPRAESSFPDSDRLIARIVTMSVVLSFMLFVHMIHCIIALGALKDKMQGYPGGINRYTFDALMYLSLDLIPSAAAMYLTTRKPEPEEPLEESYYDQFSGGTYYQLGLSPSNSDRESLVVSNRDTISFD